ncbi:hypothetical protein UlMin_037582 [Ulmus minor]
MFGGEINVNSQPPSMEDVKHLYQFFDQSTKLVVLTRAGMSIECGIPDYRSPNGAYSSGFKPITHMEFLRSSRARRRYWARSYAGWRRFSTAQPGAAYVALTSLEKAGRINFITTQNVDKLHHRAGSDPLELHGTVYTVFCLDCTAIESLDHGSPRSDESFGMKQRPVGDIEIDEHFWEEDFQIPTCPKCNGVLKPDERADKALEVAKECNAFLVLGSSLMTMSAYRLVRAAHEAGAATTIVNIGVTRADDLVPFKNLLHNIIVCYLLNKKIALTPSYAA